MPRLMLLWQKWVHHTRGEHLFCQCLPWQSLCQIPTSWYRTSQPPQQWAVIDYPVCWRLSHGDTEAPCGRHFFSCTRSPGTEEPESHSLVGDTDDTPHSHSLSLSTEKQVKMKAALKGEQAAEIFSPVLLLKLIAVIYFYWHLILICYSIVRFILYVLVNQIIVFEVKWQNCL